MGHAGLVHVAWTANIDCYFMSPVAMWKESVVIEEKEKKKKRRKGKKTPQEKLAELIGGGLSEK